MDLKIYLNENRITVSDFADRIEVSDETIYKFMSRERRLGDETKLRIIQETKGLVTLADLTLGDDELRRREAAHG